jgi:hypothetical protein
MKNNVLLLMFLIAGNAVVTGQVGIQTSNPQGSFHIDGAKDNPVSGIPTANQQANDVIITPEGRLGVGTIAPDSSSSVEVSTTSKGFLPPRMTNTKGMQLPYRQRD